MKPIGEFYSRLSLENLIALHIKENERKDEQNRRETQEALEKEILRRANELVTILKDSKQINSTLKRKTPQQIAHNLMVWTVNAGGVVEK